MGIVTVVDVFGSPLWQEFSDEPDRFRQADNAGDSNLHWRNGRCYGTAEEMMNTIDRLEQHKASQFSNGLKFF